MGGGGGSFCLHNVVRDAVNQGSRAFAFRVVSHWEASIIAHPLVLPLSVCEELQRVINHSNSELPSSMRCMRSYEVRCLPTDDERVHSPAFLCLFSNSDTKKVKIFDQNTLWPHKLLFYPAGIAGLTYFWVFHLFRLRNFKTNLWSSSDQIRNLSYGGLTKDFF